MASIPTFHEAQIEARVGPRSFRQGLDYFRSGAIHDAQRRGSTLKAACAGSGSTPYRVRVTFGGGEIVDGECTCPVGRGGYCKHVAALLMCWLGRPNAFVEVDEIGVSLERCSRRELVELIQELIRQVPDLEETVEAKLPISSARSPADPKTYRMQVAALLEQADSAEAIDSPRLAGQLTAIREIGDAFGRQGEAASAAVVYLAILCELLAQAGILAQRDGPISAVVDQCAAGLGRCLADLREEIEARSIILRTLLHLFYFDVASLGTMRGDVVRTIVQRATTREGRQVAEWIEGMLPAAASRTTRQGLGALWLALAPDDLDEDSFCRICRATDRVFDLARRLAADGKMDRALEEVRRADSRDLPRLADILVDRGGGDAVEQLVADRFDETGEPALGRWLEKRRTDVLQRRAALELSEKLLRLEPTFDDYCRVRKLGRQVGQWDELHPRLLDWLEEAGHGGLLLRICVDENDVDRAVGLLDGLDADWLGSPLVVEVARAAEIFRPDEAQRLYLAYVDYLVGAGGAAAYAEACRHLGRVRVLMKRNGAARNWAGCVEEIRHRHRDRAEFLEELEAAQL